MIEDIKKYIKKEFGFLDEKAQENLINSAISSLRKEKENLQNILETENKEEILKLVHKLKGVLLNSGFEELARELNEDDLKGLSLEELKHNILLLLKKITI